MLGYLPFGVFPTSTRSQLTKVSLVLQLKTRRLFLIAVFLGVKWTV